MRTYELVFVIQPELEEEAGAALVEGIRQTMVDNGGEVIKTEDMGRRRLAYPIGKHREGHYVLMHAGLERAAIQAVERDLKLSEDVLRHLLIRLDEK